MEKVGASSSQHQPESFSASTVLLTENEKVIVHTEELVGSAGFVSGYINLMKTILGSGMLNIPFAIVSIGVVPGLLFLTLAATLSAFGLHILTFAASKIGRTSSFFAIAQITYAKLGFIFDGAVVLKCLGVSTSYLIVIGDLMPSVVSAFYENSPPILLVNRVLWIAIFMAVTCPLSFLKKMDSLKYTSFLGLLSILYLVCLASANYLQSSAVGLENLHFFVPISVGRLRYFGVFILSFTCHQNIFPIFNEAKNNSVGRITLLSSFCIFCSIIVYTIFGLVCAATYGDTIQDNIFKSFPIKGLQYIIGRFLFVFLLAFSYPLQAHPCRASIEKLLPVSESNKIRFSTHIHMISTIGIILLTFLVSALVSDLGKVNALIGATTSVTVCYILPFVFYYKLTQEQKWGYKKIAGLSMAIFGIIVMPFSIVATFLK